MGRSLGPGDAVAGYRIESLLGRGGMAAVYLAEHDRLKRKVALKVLSPELAADESFRRRFVGESERLASVDHPNIIPIYEAGEDDDLLFIAMRYVDTTDLKGLITQEGSLDPERAVSIVVQVAGALDAAHGKGLVHRDVKPANILVAIGSGTDGGDHVYLSDFGLTKRTQETSGLTRTGFFMGTIDYVAPEQISGKGVDGRTDQYALACVLFECLTGRPPYRKDDDAAVLFSHMSEPAPSATAIRPQLPAAIDEVLATGMAKEKEDRFPYCVALARAARAALVGPTREPVAPAPVAPTVIAPAPVPDAAPPLAAQPPPIPPTPVATPPAPATPAAATPPVPATPAAATPAPATPAPATPRAPGRLPQKTERPPRRRVAVPVLVGIAIVGLVVAGFVVGPFAPEDADPTGPTGVTSPTGPTGATGGPIDGALPLAEARVFGSWDLTLFPEAGTGVETTWELEANCEERSGPHPCDVDAVTPVSGFIQRTGKRYEGTVSGELPCGDDEMQVSLEIVRAEVVEGVWRATDVLGEGTMTSGACSGDVFVIVGSLA